MAADDEGKLPDSLPRVCTQLAMYNEAALATRAIGAACRLDSSAYSFDGNVVTQFLEES